MGFPEHPRIRGENNRRSAPNGRTRGTSPHTRGKLEKAERNVKKARNIPAYAGKTWGRGGLIGLQEEHPRIRGENAQIEDHHVHIDGTSPHTRGKRMVAVTGEGYARNIPAYAGKTDPMDIWHTREAGTSPHTRGKPPPNTSTANRLTEHPRIRGENPRPWQPSRRPAGNIPAYAGKTAATRGMRNTMCGTSPHTRGKPL